MKRFLDQDISGETLEEFKSEVRHRQSFTSGHLQLMSSNDSVENSISWTPLMFILSSSSQACICDYYYIDS